MAKRDTLHSQRLEIQDPLPAMPHYRRQIFVQYMPDNGKLVTYKYMTETCDYKCSVLIPASQQGQVQVHELPLMRVTGNYRVECRRHMQRDTVTAELAYDGVQDLYEQVSFQFGICLDIIKPKDRHDRQVRRPKRGQFRV